MLDLVAAIGGAALPVIAGYGLGRRLTRGTVLPESIRFAVGSAALSAVVFLLLAVHLAHAAVFIVLALGGVALLATDRPLLRIAAPPVWVAAIAAIYCVLYLIYALTPEVQTDALHYHLSLGVEARRTGGFPARIAFYDVLPQGLETLFAMAYSIGGELAAKLVHFAFLIATVPLLVALAELLSDYRGIGVAQASSCRGETHLAPSFRALKASTRTSRRQAGVPAPHIPAPAGWCAGVFYALTPVVGVSGTAAYNDAAIAFYIVAVFYLLLEWWNRQDSALLLPLGLCAGFCYAIKFTGGLMAPIVLIAILLKRRPPWLALAGIVVVTGPWLLRATLLTGNPFAPLLNAFFPNPYFHIEAEQALGRYLRDYGGVEWQSLALEVTLYGDLLQGLLGPAWLLAPVALLAARKPAGRLLLSAAIVAGAPWLLNIGTRFLMPALPFLGLALCNALPRPLLPVLLLAHASFSWPQVIPLYAQPGAWTLSKVIPWAAEPENYERALSRLIEAHSKPGDRILDLASAPAAITSRHLVNAWQSALGSRLSNGIHLAATARQGSLFEWRSEFAARPLTGVRVRYFRNEPTSAAIQEIRLWDGTGQKLTPNVLWSLTAWPNIWDAPLVLDRNLVSGWSTWEPVRAGMFVEIELPGPTEVSRVAIVSRTPIRLELYGRAGEWIGLPLGASPIPLPALNLRRAAMSMLRREGVTHILTATGKDTFGVIGQDMTTTPKDWGLKPLANYRNATLLKIE